jgi:hypothetical protein
MLRPTISRPVCLGVKPHLGSKTRFLLLSGSCGFVGCEAHSLTGGRVCRLELLLALARAVILGSESRGTHDRILLSRIQGSPLTATQIKVKVILWPTVSRPVYLGVKHHLGSKARFLLQLDSCGFVDVGRPLSREEGSVVYNCCWYSPAQSFSGPSPAGLVM